MLRQNKVDTLCLADNDVGTGCKTKAKFGTCEIKMCKDLNHDTISFPCLKVAEKASLILNGGLIAGGTPGLAISVQESEDSNANCGSSDVPCSF